MGDQASPRARTPSPGLLVAIDVGGTSTKVACYDAGAATLRRAQLGTQRFSLSGRQSLRQLMHAARQCLQLGSGHRLGGVAVVLPGLVRNDRLLMAPNTPALEGVDLCHEIARVFGDVPIALDNDVKAAALAEHVWGALRDARNALYVNIGTGIAAAAIIDGKVYRGQHGAALEIGYQLAPGVNLRDSTRWTGWQDNIAPMEAAFSGAALDALARRVLGASSSARSVFESIDPPIADDLQRRVNAFAFQLVNVAIAFDVERIAVGGGVSRQYSRLAPGMVRLLQRTVPFPPTLWTARFAFDASLWGALELARRIARIPALPDAVLDAPVDVTVQQARRKRPFDEMERPASGKPFAVR